MRAASIAVGLGAVLLLGYEIYSLTTPDSWTISRWVWTNTETVRGASWLSLLGFLAGHFVFRREPWTSRIGIILAVVFGFIGWEVIGGLTDFPTLSKTLYKVIRIGGEPHLSIPFLFGFFSGGILWTRRLSPNE